MDGGSSPPRLAKAKKKEEVRMKRHIETLMPGLYFYVSFDGQFLKIRGHKIPIKGKVSILLWQGGQRREDRDD